MTDSPYPDDADVYDVHYSPDHYGNPSTDVEITVGDLDPTFVAYVRRLEAVAETAECPKKVKAGGYEDSPRMAPCRRCPTCTALADLDALGGD